MSTSCGVDDEVFLREDHVRYFKACLERGFPEQFVSLDTSRLTAIYFAVLGLDILGALDDYDATPVIDYILAMQIPPDTTNQRKGHCGFIGSGFLGQTFSPGGGVCSFCAIDEADGRATTATATANASASVNLSTMEYCAEDLSALSPDRYMQGHLAMTYTSLCVLMTLDKDAIRDKVDKASLVQGMKHLQQPDGSFRATLDGSECDMRFLYCACAVAAMLGDWEGVDTDLAAGYVRSCLTYEGGISLVPGAEAHGGSCYTAVASLLLMGRLHEVLGGGGLERMQDWCARRLHAEGGYNGRTNKETDSCYSFWVGATMQLLGTFDDADHRPTRTFLLSRCQEGAGSKGRGRSVGGFRKTPDHPADVLHSFYSLCWLSMSNSESNSESRSDHDRATTTATATAATTAGLGLGLRAIDVRLAVCRDRVTEGRTGAGQVVFQ